MKSSEGSAVKSADRVLDVLELLVERDAPQSFASISKALEIPKSSLFQLLRNLLARGYVNQDAGGHYVPGSKIRDLVGRINGPSLSDIISPFVESACRELNETSAFYVRSEDQVIVISTASGGQALSYTMRLGDSAPIYVVSAGRAILAAEPLAALDDYLAGLSAEAFTRQTKVNTIDIRKAIEQAAETGFGYSFEEFTPGIIGIARAVRHGGNVIGAVNFAIPSVRFDQERDRQARRVLQSTVSAIEAALDQQKLPFTQTAY